MRVAVVGHVEWIRFARVNRLPGPGRSRIRSTTGSRQVGQGPWRRSSSRSWPTRRRCSPFSGTTSSGCAHGTSCFLGASGSTRCSSRRRRAGRSRTSTTPGERTISTVGPKLRPRGHDDRLPWHELAEHDAVYFVAGDVDALTSAPSCAHPHGDGPRARDSRPRQRRAGRPDRERRGRGRALPARRARPAAPSRGHDFGPARRLGAAGWPVLGRSAAGPDRGHLRRRGQLRRRAHVRARGRARSRRGRAVRGPLRSRRAHRARGLRPSASICDGAGLRRPVEGDDDLLALDLARSTAARAGARRRGSAPWRSRTPTCATGSARRYAARRGRARRHAPRSGSRPCRRTSGAPRCGQRSARA